MIVFNLKLFSLRFVYFLIQYVSLQPCVEVKDAIRHHLNKMCELGGPLTVITNDTDEDFRNTDKCTDASTIRVRNHFLLMLSTFF